MKHNIYHYYLFCSLLNCMTASIFTAEEKSSTVQEQSVSYEQLKIASNEVQQYVQQSLIKLKEHKKELSELIQQIKQTSLYPSSENDTSKTIEYEQIKKLLQLQLNMGTEITDQLKASTQIKQHERNILQLYESTKHKQNATDELQEIDTIKGTISNNSFEINIAIQTSHSILQMSINDIVALLTDLQKTTLLTPVTKEIVTNIISSEDYIKRLYIQATFKEVITSLNLVAQIADILVHNPAQRDIEKAEAITQKIKGYIPVPTAPTDKPSAPSTPTTPSTPSAPTPSKPPLVAPGKAQENIGKANGKLRSALRRIDAIKSYAKDVDLEERATVKKKAENILKEYGEGTTQFAKTVRAAQKELGNQIDPAKFAPFNTFVELVDKLTKSIKNLM